MPNIDSSFGGCVFNPEQLPDSGYQLWSPFAADTQYFQPSKQDFMINFIVDDVAEARQQVEQGGATLIGDIDESEFGIFGWFLDPDGNKVELWQPPAK